MEKKAHTRTHTLLYSCSFSTQHALIFEAAARQYQLVAYTNVAAGAEAKEELYNEIVQYECCL